METKQELKQALEWSLRKTLQLDAENLRLKDQINQIKVVLDETTSTAEERIQALYAIVEPSSDGEN